GSGRARGGAGAEWLGSTAPPPAGGPARAVVDAWRPATMADRRDRLGGRPPPRVLSSLVVEDAARAREHEMCAPLFGMNEFVERQLRVAIPLVDEHGRRGEGLVHHGEPDAVGRSVLASDLLQDVEPVDAGRLERDDAP